MSGPQRHVDVARLRALFTELVELSPAERRAALDEQCRGDEALRLELEKLLRAAETDDDFLEPPSAVSPLSQGSSFRLEDSQPRGLAAGAHLALDARGERVYCALASLQGDGVGAIERMRSMGPKLMALRNRCIARVREVGLTEVGDRGTSVYVLCSLPPAGRPLPPSLELAFLDPDSLTATAREVSSGVDEAHELGLLHGDLGRASLWLDGTGHLQVMGWGAAAIAAGPGPSERRATKALRLEKEALQVVLRSLASG